MCADVWTWPKPKSKDGRNLVGGKKKKKKKGRPEFTANWDEEGRGCSFYFDGRKESPRRKGVMARREREGKKKEAAYIQYILFSKNVKKKRRPSKPTARN